MRPETLERMPRRPESEFEWEDLLVRVELMPRALRVALEPLDPRTPAVSQILAALASRESLVSNFLELASEKTFRHSRESGNPGSPGPTPAAAPRHPGESRDPGSPAPTSAAAPPRREAAPPRHDAGSPRLEAVPPRHPGESRDPGSHAPNSPVATEPVVSQPFAPQSDTLVQFMRLRQRNFAMLQRRGLEVWDWSAAIGAAGDATVYQVLAHLVEADVQALADLRQLVSEVGTAC